MEREDIIDFTISCDDRMLVDKYERIMTRRFNDPAMEKERLEIILKSLKNDHKENARCSKIACFMRVTEAGKTICEKHHITREFLESLVQEKLSELDNEIKTGIKSNHIKRRKGR